jgi:hypothetical protein
LFDWNSKSGQTYVKPRVFSKLCQSKSFESINSGFKMNSTALRIWRRIRGVEKYKNFPPVMPYPCSRIFEGRMRQPCQPVVNINRVYFVNLDVESNISPNFSPQKETFCFKNVFTGSIFGGLTKLFQTNLLKNTSTFV